MKYVLLFISTFLLMVSCSTKAGKNAKRNRLNIGEKGFDFQLYQRTEIAIPSDCNNVFCGIDDITAGQTILSLQSGKMTLLKQSISEGDQVPFIFNGQHYSITCTQLFNQLIGEDYGFFTIRPQSKIIKASKKETEQIERLLQQIEHSEIVFIRNGSSYTSKEAADHLRMKWKEAEGKVKTVNDFIEQIASTSTMTGKPYMVQLKNGSVMTAKEWYVEQMKLDGMERLNQVR